MSQRVNDPLGVRKKKRDKVVNNIKYNYPYPAITANNNKATIFVILIIGFTAGPAVSL